jgi:RNA polymerase primary sigma factor
MIAELMTHGGSRSECRAARLGPLARASRVRGTRLPYIDHPSFDDPSARDAILGPSTDPVDDRVSLQLQPAGGLVPSPPAGQGLRFLSREQETHLFRKMNYLKCRANRLKEQLDPKRPSPRDLGEIERLQSAALSIKNRIIERYVWLVVFVAKKRVTAGYDLFERISDGNLVLVQAVDRFDFARGVRFSTYVTWAIRNRLVENERRYLRHRCRELALYEEPRALPVSDDTEDECEAVENRCRRAVGRWLRRLGEREQQILARRYGLGGARKETLAQIGRELGISKERVRQIVLRAHAKLRDLARHEAFEPVES